MLVLKVNGRWHQLYFDSGIVFWRLQDEAPKAVEARPGDSLTYPLIDLGKTYALKQSVISDCITEPHVGGARVLFVFEDKGSLIVMHNDNTTSLRFVKKLREKQL